MIRKATARDIAAVAAIYDAILTKEEQGPVTVGWLRGVYPTEQTARESLDRGELYVMEENGRIVAAAKINQEQVPEYAHCPWRYEAPPEQVLVIHTLVVDPALQGKGYATAFVAYYEEMARAMNCPYLRMDTNSHNAPARALYKRLGYEEPGIVDCVFNGIPGVHLVCLEKKL